MRACELNQSVDRAAGCGRCGKRVVTYSVNQIIIKLNQIMIANICLPVTRTFTAMTTAQREFRGYITTQTTHCVSLSSCKFVQTTVSCESFSLAMPEESTERGNVLAWKAQRLEANIILFRLLRLREFATICPNGRRHLCHKQHRRGPATR